MDEEKPPLAAALRHLAEQKRHSLTEHPAPQDLASYHAGELPPEDEARLREHLSLCRECSDLLLDLDRFADLKPPEGVPELTDDEVEQDWQALRARMGEAGVKEKKPAEVVPIRPPGVSRPRPVHSPWLPIAASLLAVLGFSFGIYQTVQLGKLSRPRVVPVISSGNVTRGDSAGSKISAQSGGSIFLDADRDKDYPRYEAEIVHEDEVVARIPVGPIGDDSVLLVIPGPLKPGKYGVRLLGVEGDQRELSSESTFEVDDL